VYIYVIVHRLLCVLMGKKYFLCDSGKKMTKKKLMLFFFLSCVHQTYNRVCVCPITIISYSYSTLYCIISLSHHAHQMRHRGDYHRRSMNVYQRQHIKCNLKELPLHPKAIIHKRKRDDFSKNYDKQIMNVKRHNKSMLWSYDASGKCMYNTIGY